MDYIFAAISPQFLLQFAILKVLTTQWAMVFMEFTSLNSLHGILVK